MQKGRIRALISKFENNEFSNETHVVKNNVDFKNNTDFKNNAIKFSKLNSIFSSAGTLNENDEENQNIYYKSMLKESGKLPQRLLKAYQKNDEDLKNKVNINNYTKSESYMESARTLVTQSNASLLKSSISIGISQKDLNHSISQFKSQTSLNNNTLENSNFTLGNIDEIDINSNKEEDLVDNNNDPNDFIDNNDDDDNNENDDEIIENNDIILENETNIVNKENLNIQSEDVDENKNEEKDEYQDKDESFHVFDMNKIMKSIISVDIGEDLLKNYENNNKIMKMKKTTENKEIEITKKSYIEEEYADKINSNIINISEKLNNETYEEQKIGNMNINIIKSNKEDIINDKIQTINNKLNENNEENTVLDDNSNLSEENEENIILDNASNTDIEIPENTIIEKNITIEEDDEIVSNKKRNINEVENEILLDPKEKNELINNEVFSNNENQSNAIGNEVLDSKIYFENYNIVEKKENFDKKTKQYYKEKIIDNRFKLTYVLKKGGCGEIRETIDLVTGKELVCKVIPRAKKPQMDKDSKIYQYYLDYELDLLKEATISSLLIHPNILLMKYMARTSNYFYLISEKIQGEDLCDYVIRKGRLSEKETREIIFEVIVALEYLHSNYIIHRDVKCENIMREKGTGRIILLDFGSACFYTSFSSQINEFCGSPVYQAPEVVQSQPYWGPELDVWGLGVVLYVLTTGILPFDPDEPDMNNSKMVDLMYNGPDYPEYLSYECKMLISRMLCFDPNQRTKLPDVLKHPWMKSYAKYKKLKVFNFSDNTKILHKTSSNLSMKSVNSKSLTTCDNKNKKFDSLIRKTKSLFSFNSKRIYKRYINLQKEYLSLNNPFSSNSTTLSDSIFNNKLNSNNSSNTSIISQMFAYAASREDETRENKIKLLKNVMDNQMRIQRNIPYI